MALNDKLDATKDKVKMLQKNLMIRLTLSNIKKITN